MKRFKRILCEAGVGEVRTRVLKCAVDLAQNNQAELTVIDIIEPFCVGGQAARISDPGVPG